MHVLAALPRLGHPPDEDTECDRSKGSAHANYGVPAPIVDGGGGRIVCHVLRAALYIKGCGDRVSLDDQCSQLLGHGVASGIEDRTRCRVVALQHLVRYFSIPKPGNAP